MSKARRITRPQMALLRQVVAVQGCIRLHKGLGSNKDYATFEDKRVNFQTVQALIWRGLIHASTEPLAIEQALATEGYLTGFYYQTRYGWKSAEQGTK